MALWILGSRHTSVPSSTGRWLSGMSGSRLTTCKRHSIWPRASYAGRSARGGAWAATREQEIQNQALLVAEKDQVQKERRNTYIVG